ncbi:MAG: nucleoside triphosphate pyrophosphohydrolase [Candidatus Aminicenantes bacterium]|nr:nucleoside triphosphate pyrophosphohydrolase [Candidatus Aminicenantes bacterium]
MNEFKQLLKIMEILRDPLKGCPWDKVQTKESLKEYILEESYELIEAIENKDNANINEELGDLLLQIVFISQIMKESGESSISEVINTLNQKLIRRHPHIFSDKTAETPAEVKNNWEAIKKEEKKSNSILSDYPEAMPALAAAKRYGDQASSIGFDWGDTGPALEKVEEEIAELKNEISKGDQKKIYEELGDLLFSVANVARISEVNPELALRDANKKFKKRFRLLEKRLGELDIPVKSASLDQMNRIWDSIKKEEKKN